MIQVQGIRIYQPPIEPDDEAAAEHARSLTEAMPFSIIGSTEDVQTPDGRTVKGREYLWGVAEGMFVSPWNDILVVDSFLQSKTKRIVTSASCVRC